MLGIIYTPLLYLIQPFVLLRLLIRAKKSPAYKQRIAERYGFFKAPEKQPAIWIHSVSVGETIAAAPMVKQLIKRYPNHRIIVTTMTPTGSQQVTRIYGDQVFHVYAPYDLPCAVHRFLKKTTPALAIFMETELWPNTLRACARKNIPVIVANARLSARSAKGYQRAGNFVKHMLSCINTVAAQHKDDADRFLSLGLTPSQLQITGSLKYDLQLPENTKEKGIELRKQWLKEKASDTNIIIASSTHKGEEAQLLPVFRTLANTFSNLLFVIVPRHPERFDEVNTLCQQTGFTTARRSQHETVTQNTHLVLADTMGEVPLLLAASDIVYMGGSLVPTGGHNFMEPAVLGLPQVSGPHVFNFQHVADTLVAAEALIIGETTEAVTDALKTLLEKPEKRRTMGQAAIHAVKKEQGALEKHLKLIYQWLPGQHTD